MTHEMDDFTMAYQDSCDQMTLLMIHGFPLNSTMWEPQMEDLADMARIITPDLRGHGRSDTVTGPYSMDLLADDCAGLLDHLGIEDPVVLCGMSMGGYVALAFYRRYPERVGGLILVATRAGADSAEGKANREKLAESVRTEGTRILIDSMLPKLMAPQTYDNEPELVEFVQEMMEETSVEGAIGALLGMRDRPDSTPTLAEIDVPTLIIHGEDDQIIPVAEAEKMYEAIEQSTLIVIPNAGHMVNLEQSDEFSDAVADFLESLTEEDDEDDEF